MFINKVRSQKEMLELTLLKVHHAEERRAEKLEPYIQECDVCAPEAAMMTERGAAFLERWWEKALQREVDLSEMKKVLTTPANSKETNDYSLKKFQLFHQYQRPICVVEVFSFRESTALHRLLSMEGGYSTLAGRAFLDGYLDLFFEHIERAYQALQQLTDTRDEHIAENIPYVEEYLRERYPFLHERDPLRLLMCLGEGHAPERYIRSSESLVVIPQRIADEEDNLSNRLFAARQRKDLAEERRTLLALALSAVYQLPEQQFMHSSYDELLRIFEEQRKLAEDRTRG